MIGAAAQQFVTRQLLFVSLCIADSDRRLVGQGPNEIHYILIKGLGRAALQVQKTDNALLIDNRDDDSQTSVTRQAVGFGDRVLAPERMRLVRCAQEGCLRWV